MFEFLKRLRWQKHVDGAVITPTGRDTFRYTDEQGRRVNVYAELQAGGSRLLSVKSLGHWDAPGKPALSEDEKAIVRTRVEAFFAQNYVRHTTS